MTDGNKTFLIRDVLFGGKIELANELYCSSLKKGHDVSLKQIVYNNKFFEHNILILPSEYSLINDLQDYALSKGERRVFLFTCVGQTQDVDTLSWALERLHDQLSLNEKDELVGELTRHHFIDVCSEKQINTEQSLSLIKHLPALFWEQSIKESRNGLKRWLAQQDKCVHKALVKSLLHEHIDQNHPLFELPLLSQQLLQEEVKVFAGRAPSKIPKM